MDRHQKIKADIEAADEQSNVQNQQRNKGQIYEKSCKVQSPPGAGPTKDGCVEKRAVKHVEREKPGKYLVGGVLASGKNVVQRPPDYRQQTEEKKRKVHGF